MKRLFNRNFWIISLVLLSVLGLISYGFVKNLFFWREDYQIVYSYFAHIPYYFWPYQGLSFIYNPFSRLFGNNPQGYFIVSWFLLVLATFTLEIFTWKLSHNKPASLIAGLIFISGYVGSETMMMISVSIVSNLFLILLLIFLMSYENLFKPYKLRFFIFLYLICFTLFAIFSYRAHFIPILIIISEWYYLEKYKFRLRWSWIKALLKRTTPFLVTAILIYSIFPLFLATKDKHLGQISYTMILNIFNANFWKDVWNLIFPSELLKLSPLVSVALGVISLIIFAILSYKKRLVTYLALCTVSSYLIFHMFEYELVHESWHRYFFFSYAFFSSFLAILFSNLFKTKKWWFIPATIVIVGHLYLVGKSSFIKCAVERGNEARKFFLQLKETVKEISDPTLLYFDPVMDPSIESKLNSILTGGIFPAETAIATFYKTDIRNIKITNDYEEFDALRKSRQYFHQYFFFYDKEDNLINLSGKPDTKDKISLGPVSLTTIPDDLESTEIKVDNFPAYKPISIKMEMSATLTHGLETSNKVYDGDLSLLVGYLLERINFQKSVRISSSGDEFPGKIQFLADGDVQTSWMASKIPWRNGEKPWIEFSFPKVVTISEIRWLSSYSGRLPVSYEYQIQDPASGDWKGIFSVNKQFTEKNKYQVDEINKTSAKNFRMVINETSSGDFPAISEFEILSSNWNVDSKQADYVMLNPLMLQSELWKVVNNFNFYLYPITDKYWSKYHTIKILGNLFIDGKFHSYNIEIPAGGISLSKIIIEFPKLPLEIKINSISLEN